ncbi:SDR family NAD(P)-dependent oxidoreductase [Actinoplanes sp. NPDC089786]|uniref:SDR family NAD(P)-dependent oxidoreductase n=1 Tax=Actinoplanes sp. NPDC089786 TaxID=3155185 RepID=UPI003439A314
MTLDGRTVVITGASSGLGAEAVRLLGERGATVHAVGRDAERTRRVGGRHAYTVDFARLDDVRRLATELRARLDHIDVLAANAGAVVPRGVTADGIDAVFQVNAIGPWLLTTLLADRLRGGRVLATNSRSHRGAVIGDVPALAEGRPPLPGHRAYARAKLAAGILLREFGRRHPDVDVGDFHPGILATDFGRYLGERTGRAAKTAARPFLGSPADGAACLVALAERDTPLAGGYHTRARPARGAEQLYSPDLGRDLWPPT